MLINLLCNFLNFHQLEETPRFIGEIVAIVNIDKLRDSKIFESYIKDCRNSLLQVQEVRKEADQYSLQLKDGKISMESYQKKIDELNQKFSSLNNEFRKAESVFNYAFNKSLDLFLEKSIKQALKIESKNNKRAARISKVCIQATGQYINQMLIINKVAEYDLTERVIRIMEYLVQKDPSAIAIPQQQLNQNN